MVEVIMNYVHSRAVYDDDITGWKLRVYQFMWHKIVDPFETFYYNVKYGIGNLRRWIPIIWHDRDWDSVFLAEIMEFKLRAMAKLELENGHHTTSEQHAKQMLICAEILKRTREDKDYDRSNNRAAFFGRPIREDAFCPDTRFISNDIKIIADASKDEMKLFGRIIGKYLTHWWD